MRKQAWKQVKRARVIGFKIGHDLDTVEQRWDFDEDFRRQQQQQGRDRDDMIITTELGLSDGKDMPMTPAEREQRTRVYYHSPINAVVGAIPRRCGTYLVTRKR